MGEDGHGHGTIRPGTRRIQQTGNPDLPGKPRRGEVPDTNFSVIDPVTELRFSFCLVENGQGKEQWSASITRTVDGTRKSAVVYAGTPNTLIDRWETTMDHLREKAREIGA
jgi:hypothetical protein